MELNGFRPQTAATTFAFSSVCFFFNDGEVSTIQCGAYTVCYQLAPRLSWPHFCLLSPLVNIAFFLLINVRIRASCFKFLMGRETGGGGARLN